MSLIKSAVGTVAHTVGFAKGIAQEVVGAGIDVVRRRGAAPDAGKPEAGEPEAATPEAKSEVVEQDRQPVEPTRADEPDLPGPDIVLAKPPRPEDLLEPIVIEADDHPGATGESFHHEPHATTRADTVGGAQGDLFEADDEADVALEDLTEPRA